jgi:negative regulator of flagellin synthesis FlgM
MKIGPTESKPAVQPAPLDRAASGAGQGSAAVTGSKPGAESTRVDISAASSALRSSAAEPTFDTEKVERIRQQISEGTFKPKPEAIADKLIGNAQELLQRKPA